MSYTSDEFDGEIRQPLHELVQKLHDDMPTERAAKLIIACLTDAITLSDDHRMDLMDQEEDEEALEMKRHEADELGDSKLEEERDERHGL